MNDHVMLDLVPLYALDALEGREEVDFVSHLNGCSQCQAALDEYRDVAAQLIGDQPASDHTWERISAAIASSEKTPRTAPSEDGSEESHGQVVELRSSNALWKWTTAVAAVVALVLGTMVILGNLVDQPLTGDDVVAAATRLADEPGSFVDDFLVDDVAVARVVLTADGRGFVIPTESLEPLDTARTYQLWVINDIGDVISGGVLGHSPEPATFTWTGEVTGFALTREVAGGVVSSAGDVVSVISDA